MSSDQPADLTRILARVRTGDASAASELFDCLYDELRGRARQIAGRADATLQPTVLVHEAWLKLVPDRTPAFADRQHFLRAAGAAMRSLLVDHARARATQRRGGGLERLQLDDLAEVYCRTVDDLPAVDEALHRLEARDEQLARIVELRFFAGLPVNEVATTLGVSPSTVERGWRTARAFLCAELQSR